MRYSRLGRNFYVPLIFASTLLQKVALPGTGNALAVGTLVMPVLVAGALVTKRVTIDSLSLILLLIFVVIAGLGIILVNPHEGYSLASLALVSSQQFPLATRPRQAGNWYYDALSFYSSLMMILCLLGVGQFASEWFLPRALSFPVDFYMPQALEISTYNNLIPLSYGADILKSNGVFFAEPSFFSQSAALGVIVELSVYRRPIRIIIFLVGIFVSYSGTGMMLLVGFCLSFVFRGRVLAPFLVGLVVLAIVFLFGEVLHVDTITSRLNEFTTPGTSGYARFISVFNIISQYQLSDVWPTLLGKGVGQITIYLKLLPYEGFGPTWGKILFEYGLVGFFFYVLFLCRVLFRTRSPLRFPVIATYLFLGGYLTDTAVLIPLLVFVSWAPRCATTLTLECQSATDFSRV